MKKITKITPEQELELQMICQQWIDLQTAKSTSKEVSDAINPIWARMGLSPPGIYFASSPGHAVDLAKTLFSGKERPHFYLSLWWQPWAAWYEGAKSIGVEFDQTRYTEFRNWCLHAPIIIPTENMVIVVERPSVIRWRDKVLHCENGPAVIWGDGRDALWSIDGVSLTEQIVMHPETLTVDQIHGEVNTEVQRIMIERYGWNRYVEESESTVIDARRNDIEQTVEILVTTPIGLRLLTHCPSTGRRYSLGIPDAVATCEAAQKSLWGNRERFFVVGRT